ncbi:MAG: sialate O-acetylesterase [Verrucomicrobia bacterium]|nr:sialate O-acetylesterase [Verrucomicrobiota bacterium]
MIPRLLCIRRVSSTAVLLLAAFCAQADVKLNNLFTDHMVLQRDIAVPVWGWADEGEKVTVEFRGKKVSTTAKNGKWMVKLGKLKAGGPDELKVTGKNTITLTDVLVGEVWLASGQSNMEWPMRASYQPFGDILAANNPKLRLFTVPKLKANEPVDNVQSSWKETSPSSVSNFSAVAYYFGMKLQKDLGVPVGMIHTSWGGSPAEVWMRDGVLSENSEYKRDIVDAFAAQLQKVEEAVAQWEKERDQAKADGKTFTKRKPGVGWKPSELYNGMIAPLVPYAIKGAIWYQGESNAGRAHQYRTLFVDMVKNWRNDWNQGDFAFLQVQLAPFMPVKDEPAESNWAELREAQIHATKVLPKVGAVSILDYGDPKDIHPVWKRPVGERLALAARGIAYGEKFTWSGPQYRSGKIDGDKVTLSFDFVGEGLFGAASRADKVPPGKQGDGIVLNYNLKKGWVNAPLTGFAIAGEDRKFVWAKAEIVGDKIVVSSPSVANPVAVRYAWADCPVANLFCARGMNEEPLPASPFRTDNWPMITAPKTEAKK